MSYQPYDKVTASPMDRIAWALCQIIDDDAPLRWTRFRGAAECIAKNPEVMADLAMLSGGESDSLTGWKHRALSAESIIRSVGPKHVIDAKYDHVLVPFAALMAKELHANADKGDRPGWLGMTPDEALLEIYWHMAKLQRAVKHGDIDGVREYAADVANMAMMCLDVCGGLDVVEPERATA